MFTYDRERLQSATVHETVWPADPEQQPEWYLDSQRFMEVYSYDIFGQRIGVLHCTAKLDGVYAYPDSETTDHCWKQIKMYDYVDGRLLVERESAMQWRPHKRFISVYTCGPLGLIARRGLSVRNGHWNADGGALCNPNDPNSQHHGAFVYDDPDVMQNYTYMSKIRRGGTDHMGNVVGLVDSATGEARRQVFDAFGVNVGGYITFRCAADHDHADQPWHGICCGPRG